MSQEAIEQTEEARPQNPFPEYPKIQGIFKRDEKTHKFIEGEWALPEFVYLKDNIWQWTEKINGTNVRICWEPFSANQISFLGRTDKASLPPFLLAKLRQIFIVDKLMAIFRLPACLYGEGFGNRIQGAGKNYIPDDVDFILFDIRIGQWWLKRPDLEDIAARLGIRIVPIVGQGTLIEAINLIKAKKLKSVFGDFLAEGLVLWPMIELRDRAGQRIVTKLKHKDF